VIPFGAPPSLELFGFRVGIFGVLVVSGVVAAFLRASVLARREGLSRPELLQTVGWAVIGGFVAGRVGQVVLLDPALFAERGARAFFDPRAGLSSYFGFLGGALAALAYLRARGLAVRRYTDVVVECLIVGWAFGRLGCALVHDHPGTRTDLPFAVQFPDGPRHDLGLYEWVFTLAVLLPLVRRVGRRASWPGARLAAACAAYGAVRFLLDFLRARDLPDADARFAGLTFAQWGSLVVLGIAVLLWRRREAAAPAPAGDVVGARGSE
jgi:phosphatidylglycerol:prolipoprotein diacylglycerol transferase